MSEQREFKFPYTLFTVGAIAFVFLTLGLGTLSSSVNPTLAADSQIMFGFTVGGILLSVMVALVFDRSLNSLTTGSRTGSIAKVLAIMLVGFIILSFTQVAVNTFIVNSILASPVDSLSLKVLMVDIAIAEELFFTAGITVFTFRLASGFTGPLAASLVAGLVVGLLFVAFHAFVPAGQANAGQVFLFIARVALSQTALFIAVVANKGFFLGLDAAIAIHVAWNLQSVWNLP